METITRNSEDAIYFFNTVKAVLKSLEQIEKIKPLFNGDRFLTDQELSIMLKVSRRTLQNYPASVLGVY